MRIQSGVSRGVSLGLNQSNINGEFESKTGKVSDKLSDYKSRRDELNVKVRVQLDKRNEINRQVKELITEVQKQKAIRNEANSKVADLRKIRLERTSELKEIRAKLRSSSEKADILKSSSLSLIQKKAKYLLISLHSKIQKISSETRFLLSKRILIIL